MSTISNSSVDSEISLVTPILISPREVAYSQSSVGPTIFAGKGRNRASVERWTTEEPYLIPIDIVLNFSPNKDVDCQNLHTELY